MLRPLSLSLQALHLHRLHRGAAPQQPEPAPFPAAAVQPGSQRGHEDRRRLAKPAGVPGVWTPVSLCAMCRAKAYAHVLENGDVSVWEEATVWGGACQQV